MATNTTPLPPIDIGDYGDYGDAAAPQLPGERLSSLVRPRHRLVLGLILLLAAFLNFYELQREGFANLYYAAAIRSMLQSWHTFFFVSFDPGGFVTVDKPPLGFWIQAASAKLLGYSGFSILLPAALVVMAFAQAVIVADYSGWNSWMTPLIVGGSVVVAGAQVALRVASARGVDLGGLLAARPARLVYAPVVAATLGVVLLLVGPATWTGVSLANGGGGTLPAAGPTATTAQTGGFRGGGFAGRRPTFSGTLPEGFGTFGPPPGGFRGAGTASSTKAGMIETLQVNSALLSYLEAHQGSSKYLFATISSQTAAPYIIETGKAVMTLGGFSGSDQILTASQLQTLVREGQVHYFLLSDRGFGGGAGGSGNATLLQWVEAHGTMITVGGVTLY